MDISKELAALPSFVITEGESNTLGHVDILQQTIDPQVSLHVFISLSESSVTRQQVLEILCISFPFP